MVAPVHKNTNALFFFGANYIMGHFKGYFEGDSTFLTPKIVPSAARGNLGVKKVEISL
jgi:hypothetical protein